MNNIDEITLEIEFYEKQIQTLNDLIPRLQKDKYFAEQMLIILNNKLIREKSKQLES